jgi:hypothetical protein
MVGDGPVGTAEAAHVIGDLLERAAAVTPIRVVVERALEVGPPEEAGQRTAFGRRGTAAVLAQLGRM